MPTKKRKALKRAHRAHRLEIAQEREYVQRAIHAQQNGELSVSDYWDDLATTVNTERTWTVLMDAARAVRTDPYRHEEVEMCFPVINGFFFL